MERETSAVVLAGGQATRMGRDKAALELCGVSFAQHQVNKLRALGIDDVLLSGCAFSVTPARPVPDIYPHRGPLSGIHACLLEAGNPSALVLAVDSPLVPAEFLMELIAAHRGGITLASFRGEVEPLIGVYDRALARACEALLRGDNYSLRALFQNTGVNTVEYRGSPELLLNCNTPEDYRRICALAE